LYPFPRFRRGNRSSSSSHRDSAKAAARSCAFRLASSLAAPCWLALASSFFVGALDHLLDLAELVPVPVERFQEPVVHVKGDVLHVGEPRVETIHEGRLVLFASEKASENDVAVAATDR
jgi:hypothetical protein